MSSLLELLQKKKQDLAAGKRRKTAKPPEGRSRWRLAGSWRGAGQQFWHDYGQHFIKDAAGDLKAVYLCVDKTYGRDCDVCGALAHAIKGVTDDETMKLLKDAKSAGRVLLNAMHLDGANPNDMQILEVGPTLFDQIISIATEWEAAGETIFGPNGRDLVIERTGSGLNTKYTVQAAARAAPIDAAKFAKLNDLDEYVKQESVEAQQRALSTVRSVAGLLPAPSGIPTTRSGGLPVAAAAAALIEEDPYEVATPPKRDTAAAETVAVKVVSEDIPDSVTMPKAAPKAVAKPAPAAPPMESSGDPELDELLKGI